uniref:Inosine/uridine-preferring nucleoside hydrolase domain-containing protein n=1 Tax=Aegilops tauschii TaxID=37682 RepID=N1R4D4_AEGTA
MEKARRTSSPSWAAAIALVSLFAVAGVAAAGAPAPRRILVDTDMDTDDLFALLYILKQDRSQFDVKAITISANAWIDAGHGVDQLYDILYMMGRDDIAVGVGGDGGISEAGEIHPDVGGYLPMIDQRVYVLGGGVRVTGNLFTAYGANPFAEFNVFGDPFAAYQVLHSGVPVTLVPLDATNTIPVTEEYFAEFGRRWQTTPEARYCFQSLDQGYYMWDSFAAGVAFSSMRNGDANGANDFAELEYMNITVITSNKPYGVHDGSNPFFDGRATPKFGLKVGGVHSGHVQTGIRDSFCLVPGSNAGRCQDGYTKEVTGSEGVRVHVATSAKPNTVYNSAFDREFSKNFLEVLNLAKQAGRFNISTQFPYYREVLYKPDFINVSRGKPVIFDMDMSPGDFVSLIYLLKAPREVIDVKGVLVNGNGWANIASIDIVYDILHMMGRDDIPVGLGNTTAMGNPTLGCNNVYAIPLGSGGFIDSDTLYGLARLLPRSPRRYTPESTDDPEHRQPLAFEVWQSVRRQLCPGDKITLLTSGPLTNLANISLSDRDASSVIERIYVVGGLIKDGGHEKGNVFTVPSNRYAEFNMFLDPLAAKTVLESNLNITLIPLPAQRKAASFESVLEALEQTQQTPESKFVRQLFALLKELQSKEKLYHHVDIFLGEVLGAVYMVQGSDLKSTVKLKQISVLADTMKNTDGQIVISKQSTKLVQVLSDFNVEIYYNRLANSLTNKKQSANVASFEEQKAIWSRPPNNSGPGHNKFL